MVEIACWVKRRKGPCEWSSDLRGTICIQQVQRGRQEPEIWTFGEHDNEFMFYLK